MSKNNRPHKDFKDLSNSSKERLTSMLKKLHTSGVSVREAKEMSDSNLRKVLNSKAKSMIPTRKLINQMSFDIERRNDVRENTKKYYEGFGYRGKGLIDVNKQLIKIIGSTFFNIAYDLQKKYNENERVSYEHAKRLLKIPKERYDDLEQDEKDILVDYDY